MRKINFLNIPIDAITMQETLIKIDEAIIDKTQIHHSVINAGKVVLMQNDLYLKESVLSADMINADGQSIVWAARLLDLKIPERVSGIDLMEELVKLSYKKGYKCFFFGASELVVNKLVNIYKGKYSENIIAGYQNGFYDSSQEEEIANKITDSGADMLFVAITSPKKEIFINRYKKKLSNVNFIMGVGGSFDVISGEIKRAPVFMQKMGLEWFYRFIQEPKRMWKRYLIGNFKFVILIIKAKFFS